MLATGYVTFTPLLRALGATLLVAGLFGVSIVAWIVLRRVRSRLARVLLLVATFSVQLAMIYAGVYAAADFAGEVWIAIPQMARTHGILNALGFSLCGLAGWNLALGECGNAPKRRKSLVWFEW